MRRQQATWGAADKGLEGRILADSNISPLLMLGEGVGKVIVIGLRFKSGGGLRFVAG